MRVAVIGAGYVGLVTGAGLAALGHDVVISERDGSKLATLKSGSVPIFEPGLQELVTEAVRSGTLAFSDSNKEAAGHAAVVFIAVPTPQGDDGRADVSIVEEVIAEISSELGPTALVVLKSTVPTGAVESVMESLVAAGAEAQVIVNPEFLHPRSRRRSFGSESASGRCPSATPVVKWTRARRFPGETGCQRFGC